MNPRLRLLAVLNALFLLSAYGCGDESGGCGPAPEKKEEAAPGPGLSGNKGSSSGAAELITSDKRGRVPKQYQRARPEEDAAKSTATIHKPIIKVSSATAAAAAGRKLPKLGIVTVTRRRVDGVSDRVEVACRLMASSPDGECASAPNYAEIKERCCPGGLVERCKTSTRGVVLVGRGCDPAQR